MLRLRPSEITLTPADVEETRRRMARRQAGVPKPSVSAKSTRIPFQPDTRPHVRRGAVRSRDDALTSLGNIPILRPHRAIHMSTDLDSDDDPHRRRDSAKANSEFADDNGPTSSLSDSQEEHTPARPSSQRLGTTPRTMQLPFRLALRGGVTGNHEGSPTASSTRSNTEGDGSFSPSGNTGRNATQAQTPDNDNRLRHSTDGIVDPLQTPRPRALANTARQRSAPRELPQHSSADRSPPTLFLRGYFRAPDQYTFQTYQIVPRSEPRRRDTQQTQSLRGSASHSDLSNRRHDLDSSDLLRPAMETPSGTSHSEYDQSFVYDSADERNSRRDEHDPYSGLPRDLHQRISEASSSSSQPYSYYELPDSRQSSSNQSQHRVTLSNAQYDGAAPSRHASRGVYLPIRPSQIEARRDSRPQPPPRVASHSSPNLGTARGQHGLSPLPASPYSRVHSAQSTPRPSAGLIIENDLINVSDAVDAVQRNLSSPLDLLQQRADTHSSRLVRQSEAHAHASDRSTFVSHRAHPYHPTQTTSAPRQASGPQTSYDQHNHVIRRRDDMGRQPSALYSYDEQIRMHREQPSLRSRVQRSSENVPATNASTGSGRTPAHERTTNPSGSLPPMGLFAPPRPSDVSNRQRMRMWPAGPSPRGLNPAAPSYNPDGRDSSPLSPHQSRVVSQGRPAAPASMRTPHEPGSGRPHVDAIPPRNSSIRTPPGPATRQAQTQGSYTNPMVERSRQRIWERSSIPGRRQRISSPQQNQENSGEAEEQMMREELDSAWVRHAGEGGEVMDETPPRLGRIERRMREE